MPFGFPIKRCSSTLFPLLLALVLVGCGSASSTGGGGGGGTQVPAIPTGLQATAGNAQVSLTWNAVSVPRATT